jgi:hypothetical protein
MTGAGPERRQGRIRIASPASDVTNSGLAAQPTSGRPHAGAGEGISSSVTAQPALSSIRCDAEDGNICGGRAPP